MSSEWIGSCDNAFIWSWYATIQNLDFFHNDITESFSLTEGYSSLLWFNSHYISVDGKGVCLIVHYGSVVIWHVQIIENMFSEITFLACLKERYQ